MKVTTTSESPMKVTAISEPPMKEIHATSEPQMKEIHANGFGVNAQAQTDVFERDEKGRILKNERNVCAALKMSGIALSYNEFSCEYCVSGLDGYSAVDDNAVDEMYLMLHREYDLKPSFEDFFRIIKAEARRRKFDPLTEYLDRVESEWDGVPRIDEWLHAYMGAENTPLNGAFGAKHLIAAVRRARHPGCKYDTMLVLEGAQRSGKSSCVRMLCPDEDLFTDALLIGAPIKEVREATQGKWLVELAELDGMSRKEASTVKAMLSRQSDSARMAYDRLQSSIKRRFVMWGTCNESNYLRDATGNRRFWPVTVGGIDPTGAIQAIIRDRDLLWGEAAARERSGESLELPDDLGGEAREAQEERLEIDPWEETIASYASSREWVSTSEIYGPDVLDIATERQNPAVGKRVAAIFTRIGWKRVRRTIGGRRIWGYIPAHLAP